MPDGSSLCIEKAYVSSAPSTRGRPGVSERRYLLSVHGPDGSRRGVCRIGPDGGVRSWYQNAWAKDESNRRAALEALVGIKDFLLVEQVLTT